MKKMKAFTIVMLLLCSNNLRAQLKEGIHPQAEAIRTIRGENANNPATDKMFFKDDLLEVIRKPGDTTYSDNNNLMYVAQTESPHKLNGQAIFHYKAVQQPTGKAAQKDFGTFLREYFAEEISMLHQLAGNQSAVLVINEQGKAAYIQIDLKKSSSDKLSPSLMQKFERKAAALNVLPAQKDGKPVPCYAIIEG